MTRIFLSYRSTRRELAHFVAEDLRLRGYEVWYDSGLLPGASYRQQIDRALAAADIVLVLWTPDAVTSPWVRDEARRALSKGKLVSVRIGKCRLPQEFAGTIEYATRGRTETLTKADLDAIQSAIIDAAMTVESGDGDGNVGLERQRTLSRFFDFGATFLILFGLGCWMTFSTAKPTMAVEGATINLPGYFPLITGELVAALMAPFAFLGSRVADLIGRQGLRVNIGSGINRIFLRWGGEAFGVGILLLLGWIAAVCLGTPATRESGGQPVWLFDLEIAIAAPFLSGFIFLPIFLPKYLPFLINRRWRRALLA